MSFDADLNPTLFLLFLSFFVLSGFYPLWKKLGTILHRLHPLSSLPTDMEEQPSETSTRLDDFEYFIITRLAQNQGHPLTGAQLNSALHLEQQQLKAGLRTLAQKGLIIMSVSALFRFRYSLSETGRRFAAEQGFITRLHSVEGA